MDLEETEARNNCAGEDEQKSNWPTDRPTENQLLAVMSGLGASRHPNEGASTELEEYQLLRAVTKQRLVKTQQAGKILYIVLLRWFAVYVEPRNAYNNLYLRLISVQ
jgi:hypothetical protein